MPANGPVPPPRPQPTASQMGVPKLLEVSVQIPPNGPASSPPSPRMLVGVHPPLLELEALVLDALVLATVVATLVLATLVATLVLAALLVLLLPPLLVAPPLALPELVAPPVPGPGPSGAPPEGPLLWLMAPPIPATPMVIPPPSSLSASDVVPVAHDATTATPPRNNATS